MRMRDRFTEWLVVFDRSPRAQLAVVLGIALSTLVLVVGRKFAGDLQLDGHLEPMTGTFRVLIADRYNGTALVILIGFLGEAIRQLRKTRKRLFRDNW